MPNMRRLISLGCLLLFACTPPAAQPASTPALIPYFTVTSTVTLGAPGGLIIAVETPIPTPTPLTYIVQPGDTLSEIAETYRIPLDDLLAANPDVSPNSMSVGQMLLIPGNSSSPGAASSPTPVPASVKQIECYPTTDRGLWCFALVRNDLPASMEDVSAQITLVDANGAAIASQTAFLPLNILPLGSSLPLYVFFPPEIPGNAKAQVQILTAVQLQVDDPRYLPAAIMDTDIQIAEHSARVSGQISLPADANAAARVWVAAVAYDEYGRVAGVRRWEGGGIQPGGNLPFDLTVAGLGSAIKTVELFVEARP